MDPSPAHEAAGAPASTHLRYDDDAIRLFTIATVFWGIAAFTVGVLIAGQLAWPALNFDVSWLSFGRMRPVHTSAAVTKTAAAAGISDGHADLRPDAKVAYLQKLEAEGRKVMMVGDGLNDGPALANAWVSLSPASGADIAQTTADIVFQRPSLKAVTGLLDIAGKARGLARQNIGFALAYNMVAIPLAMAGIITPLLAAIAMSASSITVTLNAFRLSIWRAS